MNALVFLYKRVLKGPLDGRINAARPAKKVTVPVVMTREEVARIIVLMDRTFGASPAADVALQLMPPLLMNNPRQLGVETTICF